MTSMQQVADHAEAGDDGGEAYRTAMTGVGMVYVATSLGGLANIFNFDDAGPSVDLASPDSAMILSTVCSALDGQTAEGIVQAADSLVAVIAASLEEELAKENLALLRQAQAEYRVVRDSVAAFEVVSARIEQEDGFIGLQTTILLRVRNGTGHAVSRAHFQARAFTVGRSVAWLEEEFNYQIAGGLEPGEEATWRLQPNSFTGRWNNVRVPGDATFEVVPDRLDGADGEPLWGGAQFTSGDQALLDSLAARFPG